jgi:UDP-N-acetylmuramate--alanine ligase
MTSARFTEQGRRYHMSGVGGSGMAPMAQLSAALGAEVTGSDRNLDRGVVLPWFEHLRAAGVRLLPQDGSGVVPGLDAVVHSSAVEPNNPDIRRAEALGIPRIRRGPFLARIANERRAVAVAGTSGKSTITAMTAHILVAAGLDPSFLGGGAAVALPGALAPGSLRIGRQEWFVVETDESDGSVTEFAPAVATVANLSRDHKEPEVVAAYFASLLRGTREGAVVNAGDPGLRSVALPPSLETVFAAVEGAPAWTKPGLIAGDVRLTPDAVAFDLAGTTVHVPFPGRATVENALLAVATAVLAGVPIRDAGRALATFSGVRRRFERIGAAGGVDVFDDFAHNPVKIRAALEALRPEGALWIYYQPHGYGPTRFFRDELIEAFRAGLEQGDRLLLAPIYDAGGTADRSIRSEDLAEPLKRAGVDARVTGSRAVAAEAVLHGARAGDRVVVMGARDDTLPLYARSLLSDLASRARAETNQRRGAQSRK